MKPRYAGGVSYLFVVVCLLVLRLSLQTDLATRISDVDLYFTLICQVLCFGVLPVALWFILAKNCRFDKLRTLTDDFGIKKCSLRNWMLTFAIAVPAVIITSAVSTVWAQGLYLVGYVFPSADEVTLTVPALLAEIALTAVLPAVFEELTHRGLLFAEYRDAGESTVFVSALLFALMHQNVRQVGYTFVFGVILAMTVLYSRSLFPAIFLHFFNNLISVFMTYSDMNAVFGFIEKARLWLWTSENGPLFMAAVFVASSAVCVLALREMRKGAVKRGELAPRFVSPAAEGALPLYKDAFFLITIALGTAVTTFSLVWNIV